MKKYNFYYDESEHSRKIYHKTITADNYYDNFIAVIIGWHSENEADLFRRYVAFEEKYKYRQSKGELKSTTIQLNQLKKGFSSLSNNNICMLEDFLPFFDEKIFIYYAVISKVEYIVRQLFEDYENNLFADMDAMKYSITKSIIVYQPKEIMEGLYANTDELVTLLRNFFLAQIENDKVNESLKQKEIDQFNQIIMLLDDISTIRDIDWNYDISFVGFKKYLAEKSIEDYSLTIDKEGENGNTAKAAEQVGLCAISEIDSLSSCGIRMADMLAGVISKLLKALHNSLKYSSLEEQIHKKILDKSWFMINERQLVLYKKLYNVLVELNDGWYKAFAGTYSDDLIVLIAFLGFMNHFETAEAIQRKIDMQSEYFNTYACKCLSDYHERIRNKLYIDPIGDTSKEYFLNQRGAKVYYDYNRQPVLEFKAGRRVCDVLAIGFNREKLPLVTIMEAKEIKCYRLPTEFLNWAITLVGLANNGVNLFPSKVMFSQTHEGCYADIL